MPVLPLGVQSLHVLQGTVGCSGEVRISCGEQVKHAGVEIDVLNLQLLHALLGGTFEGGRPLSGLRLSPAAESWLAGGPAWAAEGVPLGRCVLTWDNRSCKAAGPAFRRRPWRALPAFARLASGNGPAGVR